MVGKFTVKAEEENHLVHWANANPKKWRHLLPNFDREIVPEDVVPRKLAGLYLLD